MGEKFKGGISSGENLEGKESKEQKKETDQFFDKVEKMRKFVEKGLKTSEKWLDRAKEHPGMQYNMNIWRTPDGRVWRPGSQYDPEKDRHFKFWIPVDNEEEAPTEKLDGAVRSNPDHSDDWAWESPDREENRMKKIGLKKTKREDPLDRYIENYREDLVMVENCRNFVEIIFKNKEKINAWVEARARTSDREIENIIYRDWDALMDMLNIPDSIIKELPSRIEMMHALTAILDKLAGIKWFRQFPGY